MIIEVNDPKEAREWVKKVGKRSPVLAEVELHVFRGATLYLEVLDNCPISFNVTRIGKRKKNIWEPYANWYTAYTREDCRRRGFASHIARKVKAKAIEAGCRRLKALAGTYLGLMLHAYLEDQFWGVTDLDEVVVDTPLVFLPEYAGRIPPNAVEGTKQAMSLEQVLQSLDGRQLRYDVKK